MADRTFVMLTTAMLLILAVAVYAGRDWIAMLLWAVFS